MISNKTVYLFETFRFSFLRTTTCKNCSINYKDTLLLPKTQFPHKVKAKDRKKKDAEITEKRQFDVTYISRNKTNLNDLFVLHDGPPYANGDVHIGHAVNKILKDITLRYHSQQGHQVNFKPGWDCHGLPIELKVLKDNQSETPLAIRQKAYEFSQTTKTQQLKSFASWGLLTDWNDTYYTCHPDYIIHQLNVFQDLYDKGIIIRDNKPVFWSPQNQTSLAEAELEYNQNHISPSVFIKFCIKKCPDFIQSTKKVTDLYILIWTTTPWSIPANQAVCYSAKDKYCLVQCPGKHGYYLIALEMISSLEKTFNTQLHVVNTFEGSLLSEVSYVHPMTNQECPLLASSHVTMEKGTGLVHSAPNHGLEDYAVALKYSVNPKACNVDERGCYTIDAGSDLVGLPVLSTGSERVLELLGEKVLHQEKYVHSYPYDWRSKTPVILRSSPQWFLDVPVIRQEAIDCLDSVKVIPSHLKKAFRAQLECSPPWCISRQRAWGVPIPAFFPTNADSTPLVHREVTQHLCSLIQKDGIHAWWDKDNHELLPENIKKQLNLDNDAQYEKGKDIMDIWLDSGISWSCVLPDPQVSDVCIEGVDQIRGWFNSSLLTSVALRKKAPFKSLFLHGFVTDAEGRKMSKSEGNVISPDDIQFGTKDHPGYGIDVMRWWVASHASHAENIALKKNILDDCEQNINKVRNVFKFLLGCISSTKFGPFLPAQQMASLDIYMLHSLQDFENKVKVMFSEMQYKSAMKQLFNFVANDVSAFYCHLVKDRLYCSSECSPDRQSCLTVLSFILDSLIKLLWPVCPHLAEEASLHFEKVEKMPKMDLFLAGTLSPVSIPVALQVRNAIAETKTVNMDAYFTGSELFTENLKQLSANLTDVCGVSEFFQLAEAHFCSPPEAVTEAVHIQGILDNTGERFNVTLSETRKVKCPRCRLFKSEAPESLCRRCSRGFVNVDSRIPSM